MPKKVSQLQLRNRSQITNAFQVVVTDPTNYSLYRVPTTQFRGASVFTSENEPTTTPEDPLINEYVDGDIFIQDTQAGQKLYIWNATNGAWDAANKLNGLRLLSASDFPDEVNLDLRETNLISDIAYENDYYLNKTLDLLFGTYSSVTGFKFGSTDFSGYKGFRAPITHTFQGTDVNGYDNPSFYLNEYLNSAATAKQKLIAKRPIHNDLIKIELENDEGHGGWYYVFDTNISPTGTTLLENYNILLGTNVAGDQPLIKKHWREARTWNEQGSPVQNDNKYRQGDNVFDVVNGVLYYNYQEGLTVPTSDLGQLFEGQTTLAGSSLKASQDVDGNWVDPASNDGSYKQGDFIFTASKGTPRIHGPYKFGAASDKEAWPLYATLRSPITHIATAATALPTSFSSDYPIHSLDTGVDDGQGGTVIVETMITEGDTWEKVYVSDLVNSNADTKRVTLSQGVKINYIDSTLDWGTETKAGRPPRFWRQDTVGQPVKDDNNYYAGDYVITVDGSVYGSYVESAADNATAWPFFTSLKASKTVRALDQLTTYTPSTANNHSSWGGGTIAEGDTLLVYYAGSNTGKYREYLATDIDVANGNTITWQEVGKAPVIHATSSKSWPDVNDADYRTGDFIDNGSGIRFGAYVEGQVVADKKVAWVFSSVKRSPKKFYKNSFTFATTDPITVLPSTTSYFIGDEYWGAENKDLMLVVGDTFTFISDDNKIISYEVQSVDYTSGTYSVSRVAGVGTNSKIHNSTETSTPQRNDNIYSAGDFIINANGVMYGPYVEGQSTDVSSWPLKQSLRDNIGIIVDTGSVDAGKNWKFVVENGIIRIEEAV